MGIKEDLWPDENGKYLPLLFTMTREQRKIFLTTLKNVKMLDGYSSNISRCIDDQNTKISGLKSHDCHILMQHLLPLTIRYVLPDSVTAVLILLALCHLEILLPPSFFIVMVHLTCHLVEEVKLGGQVYYRWMYPIERMLGHLKSFARNRAQPEEVESRSNRSRHVDDRPNDNETSQIIYPQLGRSIRSSSTFTLTLLEKTQAHRYLLLNCPNVQPYVE
ncbi:hypothetical protein CR513_09723, partial [Mucuna pruriens]